MYSQICQSLHGYAPHSIVNLDNVTQTVSYILVTVQELFVNGL